MRISSKLALSNWLPSGLQDRMELEVNQVRLAEDPPEKELMLPEALYSPLEDRKLRADIAKELVRLITKQILTSDLFGTRFRVAF